MLTVNNGCSHCLICSRTQQWVYTPHYELTKAQYILNVTVQRPDESWRTQYIHIHTHIHARA
jgi:hypothetical protein